MSTRRVKAGQRRLQNGWASAPEFDDLRGLNGNAVALKAGLLDDPKKSELLYFLQARSLKIGAKGIARELMEMFPERIASPTMFKIGCKPGKRLTQQERESIADELLSPYEHARMALAEARRAMSEIDATEISKPEKGQLSADDFIARARNIAENSLDEFLERFCCDPYLTLAEKNGDLDSYRHRVMAVSEATENEYRTGFEIPEANYFHDLPGSLFEYKARLEKSARETFVETSIGKVAFEALDYALETGRSALIEGNSGIGKTTALEAWCEMHSGRARLVKLKNFGHRTGFFREVARALGVARGSGLSPGKIQDRLEQFLQRSKIMLVIDEGQYLMPPGNRVGAPPELINWLMTACYNEGVPFVISATSEFRKRRAIIEKNTTWQSEQLRRRIRRYFPLPEKPTKTDLLRVAEKLLPGQDSRAVEYVVGYSMTSGGFFQAITDVIDDARILARREGREKITFADLKFAVQEWRSPSDAALQRVFEKLAPSRRGRRPAPSDETHEQSILGSNNGRLNGGLNTRLERAKAPALAEISDLVN